MSRFITASKASSRSFSTTSPTASLVGSKPATASEYHKLARQLLQEEHYAESIEQFTQALKLDPSYALAFNGRGYAHLRLKHYSEAIWDFGQAILLNPAYANAYLNRSTAKRLSGDKSGAEADQAKVRELTPQQ